MGDFLLLMHDDTLQPVDDGGWDGYFARLGAAFRGGSSIGDGVALRAAAPAAAVTRQLTGFIRIEAASLAAAQALVAGNPVFEAGGTVEVRHLPVD